MNEYKSLPATCVDNWNWPNGDPDSEKQEMINQYSKYMSRVFFVDSVEIRLKEKYLGNRNK